MGILDDAIREHLELKRQHGAESSDLERLENEAFGPATRPGDPEFADPDAPEAEVAGEGAEAPEQSGGDRPGFADWFAEEAPTTVAPSAEVPAVDEPVAGEEPDAGPGPTPAEQARAARPDLGDTVDHPAPRQLGPEDEAEAPPQESAPPADAPEEAEEPAGAEEEAPEPPEAPESGIFEGEDMDFGELDVDLDSDEDELASPPAPVSRPEEEGEGAGGDEDEEDLLEETPEFLQDAPEGEDLWFEQGPPKDFDFDDDK